MIERTKSAIRALLPKNAFARGVSILVGGTASAQLLLGLAAPLLTRLYTPEDFGLFAVYVSLLALIGVVASLRYELAIPLPEDEVEAANVAALSLFLVAVITTLTAVLIVLLAKPIAAALGVPALAGYLWLLPVGVLLAGCYNVFNYWFVRTKRFSTIASTRIRQSLATLAIQFVAFKLGGVALLLGQVAGQSVGTVSLARPALAMRVLRTISWRGMKGAIKRYRQFPLYSTWGALFNTLSTQLPALTLAAVFGGGIAGLFFLAHRVLAMPSSLIGVAISQVFLANASDAKRNGTLSALVASVHEKLAYIAMPPMVVLIVSGPDLFGYVFGAEWRSSGEFARWMAPWLYLMFITSPLSLLFPVLEKQQHEVAFQGVLLLSRLSALFVGVWAGDILLTVILFSFASAVNYVGVLIWEVWVSENQWSVAYVPTVRVLAFSLLSTSPLIFVGWLDLTHAIWWAAFVFAILMFAAWYIRLSLALWRPTEEVI